MPPKPNARNWNDVQTAIATVAIVTTLGLWNLFATPAKAETIETSESVTPPTEPPVAAVPTVMPQVKIMFTQTAPQNTVVQQTQNNNQNNKKKKKKDKSDDSGGGGGGGGGAVSVTQTQSS